MEGHPSMLNIFADRGKMRKREPGTMKKRGREKQGGVVKILTEDKRKERAMPMQRQEEGLLWTKAQGEDTKRN